MCRAPARTIQELAGHADLATTMRYMHLTDAAIALVDQPWRGRGPEVDSGRRKPGNS